MPQPDGEDRAVVIGAWIAGLCAAGRSEVVLERARGVASDAPSGPRVDLAGELFFPGGGASAAWMSGERLARLILAEER